MYNFCNSIELFYFIQRPTGLDTLVPARTGIGIGTRLEFLGRKRNQIARFKSGWISLDFKVTFKN